jgi:hypothetical protein
MVWYKVFDMGQKLMGFGWVKDLHTLIQFIFCKFANCLLVAYRIIKAKALPVLTHFEHFAH